ITWARSPDVPYRPPGPPANRIIRQGAPGRKGQPRASRCRGAENRAILWGSFANALSRESRRGCRAAAGGGRSEPGHADPLIRPPRRSISPAHVHDESHGPRLDPRPLGVLFVGQAGGGPDESDLVIPVDVRRLPRRPQDAAVSARSGDGRAA